jgi:hypothetical protein
MAQVGLASICGSRARSGAEGAELGRLPAWLDRFLFPFSFIALLFSVVTFFSGEL